MNDPSQDPERRRPVPMEQLKLPFEEGPDCVADGCGKDKCDCHGDPSER